jgi:outer membrane protein assembly factor BamB
MTPNGKSLATVAVLAALLLPPTPARGQEWTRFRGPDGTGISTATGIPITFTAAEQNWRVALPGVGASSPVLWGGKIFLTSSEEEQGQRYLLCLDTADGRILWKRMFPFTRHPKHQLNGFASSTPAVDAEQVYVLWTHPEQVSLHALDHQGKEVWKRDLGSYQAPHGGGGSPIVVGDVVIVALDQEQKGATPADGAAAETSFVIGLDRKTGAIRWKRPFKSGTAAGYATPAVYQPAEGVFEVVCSSNGLGLGGLDPRTGEWNWVMPGVFKQRCVASPVIADGRIYQTEGTGGGEKSLVAVKPGSKQGGRAAEMAYRIPRDISYVPTPIAYGGRVFCWGDAGIVTCVKAATGEVVTRERVGGTFFGSPVCINGKLYAMNDRGELIVVEASDTLKILGKSDLGEPSQSTPAIAGGRLYLRTTSHLISVGGRRVQSRRTETGPSALGVRHWALGVRR